MTRITAFIDGFNFYHAMIENGCDRLKWIDYYSLADAFVAKSREQLTKVFYFTAIVPWDTQKAARHRLFIRALEFYDIEVVIGKFKEVTRRCRICGKQYKTFEEKETDVSIGVTMLTEAFNDTFDKAFLFSGDSDMIAGVKALKNVAPHKQIHAIIPIGRSSFDLANTCHFSSKIKRHHLERNQLPENIALKDGSVLSKPKEWF